MKAEENKPVSIGNWIITFLIMAIPLVNLIMLLVWAFGNTTHPSKKSYAQAILILGTGGIVLALILTLISFASTHAHH
jgi:hypothetical protein